MATSAPVLDPPVSHDARDTTPARPVPGRAHGASLADRVLALKRERHAVIVAHNYQDGAIQDIADFTGDSLKLAKYARTTDAEVIVFCGVHFMAETAAMLCPDKTVLVPDVEAGCSLADMVTVSHVRQWKAAHPGGVVVCYINTSAAVQAECDLCCTSANGIPIIASVPADTDILFIPDYYLGSYLKSRTQRRNLHLWKGYCPAHVAITSEGVDRLRDEHPDAEFLMHPECGCLTKSMDLADKIQSTDAMVQYVKESPAKQFIIATDVGLLARLRKENPGKTFYPASAEASCHHMRRNTLAKVFQSLMRLEVRVTVDPAVARRALVPIERMLARSS